jgi:hypothetical protein
MPAVSRFGLVALASCCWLVAPTAAATVHIYVDATAGRADDTPTASAEDPGRPLRTLRAGQLAARSAMQRPGVDGVTVHAAAGAYAPLSLGALDTAVRFDGAPGASISAGVSLPPAGFEAVPPSDPVHSRLPAAVRATSQRFNLGALGVTTAQLLAGNGPEGARLHLHIPPLSVDAPMGP